MDRRKFFSVASVSIASIALASVFSVPVFADGENCAILLSSFCDGNIGGLITLIVQILTAGIVVAATIGIIWMGRIILTARDNASEVARAKKRLFEIVLGLIAWTVATVAIGFFVPGFYGSIDSPDVTGLVFERSETKDLKDLSQIKPDYKKYERGGSSNTSTPTDDTPTPTSTETGTPVTPSRGQNEYNGMTYFLNVPQGATTNMPLMIWLHGSGETGQPSAVQNYYQTQNMFARSDFISLVPVAPSRDWEDGKLGTLKAIIDNVVSEYGVNKNKIYIWGFSMGGRGVYYMLHAYPGFFRAAVPVSNCFYNAYGYSNIAKTPVRAIMGGYETGDFGACMQNDVAQINAAGGSATFETVPGQSHSTISGNLDYSSIFSWMLSK